MPMLSLAKVAERLGVSRQSVFNYVKAGRLRAHRIGPKVLRVSEDDLRAFIAPL